LLLEFGDRIAGFDTNTINPLCGMKGSCLYQIDSPPEITTYGALFEYFTKQKMIPMGILRGVMPHSMFGPKGNSLPYVYTNPGPSTVVYENDKIFVLSPTPLQASISTSHSKVRIKL